MRKNSGFTLIELLAVIIVLVLLGLIVYPAIEKTIKNTRDDLSKSQVTSIENAARNWIADNPYSIPKNNGDELVISLCQLKIGSYIDQKLINPKTDKMYDCKTKIIVKNENNRYNYTVDFSDTVEENVPSNLSYPSVKIDDDYLVYIKKSDIYKEPTLTINDTEVFTLIDANSGIFTSNNENSDYEVKVVYNNNEQGIDTNTVGSNLITYSIIDKSNNITTTVYRNVIVVNEWFV